MKINLTVSLLRYYYVRGKMYRVLSKNMMWQSLIELCKKWVLQLILTKFWLLFKTQYILTHLISSHQLVTLNLKYFFFGEKKLKYLYFNNMIMWHVFVRRDKWFTLSSFYNFFFFFFFDVFFLQFNLIYIYIYIY